MKEHRSTDIVALWTMEEPRTLYSCPVLTLEKRPGHSPISDKHVDFCILRVPDWVNVIPITPQGNVVLVRQFRAGTNELSLEIPGGMVDHRDSNPGDAAARELIEETGYASETVSFLGTVTPNPALQDNLCHSYLAWDVTKVSQPNLDPGEEIQVTEVPLSQIPDLIREGQIKHALVLAAFAWLLGYGDVDTVLHRLAEIVDSR
ncbi:MAG: NUDIX hydrolase [Deltaproteobacteria bacterium]|nr:NUDIX hydrolase [Deltaproteobacteria bacterium]